MHNPNKNVLIMSIKEKKNYSLHPMRRKKKKGESVCTRTGKKKRLRRQSGVKEEQKKNYDSFQFMQRRNLSFLLFSLSLLLGLFFRT